jgi:RNA polymerase sigma-70 factor (ECF subfamily)
MNCVPRTVQTPSSRLTQRATASKASPSDDALLARTARGDRTAWGTLVNRHLSAVVRYAGYVLKDETQAEDIAQDTFVRLARKATDWTEGGPSLRSWLYRVARNLCIDHMRTRRTTSIEFAEALPDPRDGATMERDLDMKHLVTAALDRLPERQRAAIVLVHFEGLSGMEAGTTLNISVEAIESLLARARRTLRHDLASLAPDLLGEH